MDPQNWEANFYTTYYQSMKCTIAEIQSASNNVINCEKTVFELIRDNVQDADEQRKAVDEVAARLIQISQSLFNAYKQHYDRIPVPEGVVGKYAQQYADYCSATQQYANYCSAARNVVYIGGDLIIEIFGDKYGDIAAACWELGVAEHNILNSVFSNKKLNAEIIQQYNEKIKKYNTAYNAPPTNMGGGCYIATCVYGSYDCPQVWTLRRYRDYTLVNTWYGRVFILVYYAISPIIVKFLGHKAWFKRMWKVKLDNMVAELNANGVLDTPYKDSSL